MPASKGLVTLACALGVLTPLLWFASLVTPGEEAVKIRNGLVAEVGRPADFNWTPGDPPPGFKLNAAQPNAVYASTVQSILEATDPTDRAGLPLALAFSRHLMTGSGRVGGPIQSSLDDTYRRVTQKGQGYCADFTRVFTGLAVTAGLPVRTWSISFESFGAGHSFNEIYDQQLGKWVMVDPFHSIHFVDRSSREPLSVLELHDRLVLANPAPVAIEPIVTGAMPFATDELAFDYYRRGFKQLALVWGDNVFDYDQSVPVKVAAKVSRHAERALAIGLGIYPDLKIYPEGRSSRDVDALFRLRDRFIAATILTAMSVVVFGILLVRTWSRARGAKHAS